MGAVDCLHSHYNIRVHPLPRVAPSNTGSQIHTSNPGSHFQLILTKRKAEHYTNRIKIVAIDSVVMLTLETTYCKSSHPDVLYYMQYFQMH